MPHEFLNESISGILFISTLCTAIILLLWLHPLCHLSPCVPFTGQHQIFIASLFFNKPSTCVSAFSPSLLHSGHFHSQVQRDRLGIHFSDDFSSSSFQTFMFWLTLLSLSSNTLNSTQTISLLCIVILSIAFMPPPHFLLSCLPLYLMPSFRALLLLLRSAC